MKHHYNYGSGNRRDRRRKLNIFDIVVLFITVGCTAALLLAHLAQRVNPLDGWPIAILGLAWPVLYIANIILALYWILRWRSYMLMPLAALALGLGFVSLFLRPSLRKHYGKETEKPSAIVMTYNVEGFLNHDESNNPRLSMDSIAAFIEAQNPNILCLQEYQTTSLLPAYNIERPLGRLANKSVYYAIPYGEKQGWGLAIYSSFPIIDEQSIQFPDTRNCALRADIVIARDTVRVFNCHLQTTSLSFSDRKFMTTEEFVQSDTELKKKKVKRILGKLRDNYRIRSSQADSIAQLISLSPYPVIVCGDFNDTPMSYSYKRVRGGLTDAFVEKGRGQSNTYRGFFNLFRIDYILHDPVFRTVSYYSPESDISDHNAVVAGLRRAEK